MMTHSYGNDAVMMHPALRHGGPEKESGNGRRSGMLFEANVFVAYAGLMFAANWVYHQLGGSFENASTLDKLYYAASIVEAFGLLSLLLKIGRDRSVGGLSGKTMCCYCCEYFLRTLCLAADGNFSSIRSLTLLSFEFLDVLALLMALRVLYCIFRKHRDTYQQDEDSFPVHYLLLGCLLLPMILEADMRMGPMKNYIWNVCLYLEMTSLLPQVYMIAKAGVGVEALVSHFVAATTCSRLLDVVYWYNAFSLVAPIDGGFNFSGWLVVACHVLHALLLCDFMYYYVKFRLLSKGGMMSALPEYVMMV